MRTPHPLPRPELEALLAEVAKLPPMTPEQVRAQRISFVYGQLMDTAPSLTREDVAEMHDAVYGPPDRERIVTSAVRAGPLVFTADVCPCRHGDVIEVMLRAGLDTVRLAVPDNQGFLTSAGRFVTRREAHQLAVAARQIDGVPTRELYSEDVW